ncbi:MAG: hypothetical protein D6732_20835 [Methanobacteriota archaeon]|nr:MAG: hypothetical protein D6732_20835 [Euryarchaeota archaeon]
MNDSWTNIFSNEERIRNLVHAYLSNYQFVNSETIAQVVKTLTVFIEEGRINVAPPFPDIEVQIDRAAIIEKFIEELSRFAKESRLSKTKLTCIEVRSLAGQRFTQGSITDCQTKIPKSETLVRLAEEKHKETELIVAARALSKHQARSSFWGKAKGGIKERNQQAINWIYQILEHKTWWNMYGHFRHKYIYEARLVSGHGARWASNKFIGFVEPFYGTNDQNLSVR